MSTTYKITYEHRDGNLTRAEEVLIECEGAPTDEEVNTAVMKDTASFHDTGVAGFSVISVVPVP